MQRKPDESFEDYKIRRKAANEAVKNINAASKGGKQPNPRVNRPNKGKVWASYGAGLRAHFAKKALEKIKAKKENVK